MSGDDNKGFDDEMGCFKLETGADWKKARMLAGVSLPRLARIIKIGLFELKDVENDKLITNQATKERAITYLFNTFERSTQREKQKRLGSIIKTYRENVGLSIDSAAKLIYTYGARWSRCEAGDNRLTPAEVELFLIKTGQIKVNVTIERVYY